MKFFILTLTLFSLNAFAGQVNYNCMAIDAVEEAKLDKVASSLGSGYLKNVKILLVKAKDCADATTMEYSDQCKVGKFKLNIIDGLNSELLIGPKKKIKLICEVDQIVYPQPAGGGSN